MERDQGFDRSLEGGAGEEEGVDASGWKWRWWGRLDLEVAKEKVVEGWTGGVTWVSQKINDVKLQHQQQQQQQGGGGQMNGSSGGEREMNRLDSQGFPSSFQKDG